MKKVYSSAFIGGDGLFYLGFIVSKGFDFPYRIHSSAEIGINAEIKLLNEDKSATVIIIKAQVKSRKGEIEFNYREYKELASNLYQQWSVGNPLFDCVLRLAGLFSAIKNNIHV